MALTAGTDPGQVPLNEHLGQAAYMPLDALADALPYTAPGVAMVANDMDCALGNIFSKTINGATAFTFSNVPAAGRVYRAELFLSHVSGAFTMPAGSAWADGVTPTFTANRLHRISFTTTNGGVAWTLAALPNYPI